MDDLVERLPKEAAMLRAIAQSYSRGVDWQVNLSASAAMIDKAAARIQALETSLAEAEGRVIAEVVAWLRDRKEMSGYYIDYVETSQAADILETGEWKK